MRKLTKRNYFTKANTHITNSKVSDFMRSKEVYKKKWIDWTWDRCKTPSMILGSIVDEYISTGKVPKSYQVKVLKKDDPVKYETQQSMNSECLISQDVYDKAINMSLRIVKSDIYKWLKARKVKFQVLLTATYNEVPVAGLLDALVIEGDTAYVLDFKTSNERGMLNLKAWYWHCKDFNYFRQMAHYGELVRLNYPEVKNIIYRHIVISSSEEDNYTIKIFELDPVSLRFAEELEIFKEVTKKIASEVEFKDFIPTMADCLTLKNPDDSN